MVNVLIFGATGLVGKILIDLISKKYFPYDNLILVASNKSVNKKITIKNTDYIITSVEYSLTLDNLDIIFFCASSTLSAQYIPQYLKNNKNVYIIDNSSNYRLDKNVDIIIPPLNTYLISRNKHLYANSNCTTAGLVMAIHCLHKYNISKLNIVSLQSVSGSGYNGLKQLEQEESISLFTKLEDKYYNINIRHNLIPQIGKFDEFGNTEEENKLHNETLKILSTDDIIINAKCIRIPIEYCHSLVVNIEFKTNITKEQIENELIKQKGVIYIPDKVFTPYEIKDKYEIFVSRLTKDRSDNLETSVFTMFITFNNLFKGASYNSMEIAEYMIDKDFFTKFNMTHIF